MHAIIEAREPWFIFLKRRAKRLGVLKVFGQVLFHCVIAMPMMKRSKKRKQEIYQQYRMNPAPIPTHQISQVKSINDQLVIRKIKEINPDIIIVNGTRIISKKHIIQFPCLAINTHAGITPKYRGVHGAYWALANKDPENSGVTVHQVDVGIDTGKIISQQRILITPKDNFTTYPLLQLGEGLQLLENAIQEYFSGNLHFIEGSRESKLWYHPTLWDYLKNRLVYKVR